MTEITTVLQPKVHSLRAMVLCLAAALFCLILPFTPNPGLYALVLMLAFCVIGPAWYDWFHGSLDLFEPIHVTGVIYFTLFGLGAIWTVNDPGYVAYDLYIIPFIPKALLYCLLGYIALLTGYYGPWHRQRAPRTQATWPNGVMFIVAIGGVGFIGQYAAAAWNHAVLTGQSMSAAVSSLGQFAPLFLVAWALVWLLYFSGEITREQRWVTFGMMVPFALAICYFLLSDKSLLMSLAGIPVVARWYAKRRAPWAALVVLLLLLIFVVFPVITTVRWQDQTLSQVKQVEGAMHAVGKWDSETFQKFSLDTFKRRLAMINSVAVIVRDVGRWEPYAGGETLVNGFASVVPRVLWPDKPLNIAGREFGRTFRVTNAWTQKTFIGATIPGELYWNFDLPGILIGMGILGAMVRFLYRRYGESVGVDPVRQAICIYVLVQVAHAWENLVGASVVGVFRALVMLEVLVWLARRAGLVVKRPVS